MRWASVVVSAVALRLVAALRCSVCRDTSFLGVGPYQNEINRFRVAYNVPRPYCRLLETLECDRDQELCATVVAQMPSTAQGYWIGMGCGTKANYPQDDGCERIAQDTRAVSFNKDKHGRRRIIEDRAISDVCVCRYDNCNAACSMFSASAALPILLFLLR